MTMKKEPKFYMITEEVFSQIRETVGSHISETGGILGSSNGKHIDHFYHIFAFLLADRLSEAADMMKVSRFPPNVKPIRKKPYLWAQWWERNLLTVVHLLNPLTAHSFKLCLNM